MTYLANKPVVSLANQERQLITIEFAPKIDPNETEYTYLHPQFVFGDRVLLVNSFPSIEYTVCALELIESKTASGKLLNQPYWKYKISNRDVTFWKDESALIGYTQKTCSSCDQFKNYNQPNGKGWCNLFNYFAKTNHKKTNDCIINGALDHNHEGLTTEVTELDRNGYPMEETVPTGYFATDFVTNPNEPF